MHIDLVSVFTSGLSVATLTFFAWLTRLGIVNQGQIRNLGDKIDHLEEKLEQKIDMMIESNTTLMKSHDDRIARLEKYFDVIMQTQIKKNEEQLKMET